MKRLGPLLLALVLLVGVAGCDTQAYRALNRFVRQWTGATIAQTLRYTFGISTGSSWVDAMVDDQKASDEMKKAELLYYLAITNNDRGSLEEAKTYADDAIRLRPTDYRFRITRAAIAIQQGDYSEMDFQMSEQYPRGPAAGSDEYRQELREIRNAQLVTFEELASRLNFKGRKSCETFYLNVWQIYQHRVDDGGEPSDRDRNRAQAAKYLGLYQGCAALPG